MAKIVKAKKLALDLPEKERAAQAPNLEQVPRPSDEDEGIAAALRPDADMDANRDHVVSESQTEAYIQKGRG